MEIGFKGISRWPYTGSTELSVSIYCRYIIFSCWCAVDVFLETER